jgi:two-component system response regulator PilR (NtrC family)
MAVRFEIEAWLDGGKLQSLALGSRGVSIGRESSNDMVLADPSVSKRHVHLIPNGSQVILSDLKSAGGTYVRHKRIELAKLSSGDEFQVGPYHLRLVARSDVGPDGEEATGLEPDGDSSGPEQTLQKDLQVLGELTVLVGVTDLKAVLESILHKAMSLGGCSSGFVVLAQERELSPVIIRRGTDGTSETFSRTLCQRCLDTKRPLVLTSVADLVQLGNIPSIDIRPQRSILVVPLVDEAEALGVLYMEGDTFGATSEVASDLFMEISSLGGRALRAALERHHIIREEKRWRWLASKTQEQPDLFASSRSPCMRPILELIRRAATEDVTILVRGETGTGKEVVAQTIHGLSRRREGPFTAINCGALPKDLLEAELFGYEKGAFTGAEEVKPGRLELAEGGTLLLDEIGDLPRDVQVKFLRALETRTLERLGGRTSIRWNARVIAATHRNLEEAVNSGEFRRDLYYRINVLTVELPALRSRMEDLELLVREILFATNRKFNRRILGVSAEALAAMRAYDWPGNVRELRNVIERAFFLEKSDCVTPSSLPFGRPDAGTESPVKPAFSADQPPLSLEGFLQEQERSYVRWMLEQHGGNVTHAARALGIARVSLQRKLKQLGLRVPESEIDGETAV